MPPISGCLFQVCRPMPSPHGGHTFDGVAGLPPRVRGHPMQRFNPRLLAFPPTRGFTLLMTTPTPVATPFSARTKIHLYHPSTAAFNVPFLHAHGDSSGQTAYPCWVSGLSPRAWGFVSLLPQIILATSLSPHARASARALHGRVLNPFFPNTQIHTPLPRLTAKPVHLSPRTCKAYPALYTGQLS